MAYRNQQLACDMRFDCDAPVTHMDHKGFVYCTEHGLRRRVYCPCRSLRPFEVRKLQRGEVIAKY
jgi:hypothetical protein